MCDLIVKLKCNSRPSHNNNNKKLKPEVYELKSKIVCMPGAIKKNIVAKRNALLLFLR